MKTRLRWLDRDEPDLGEAKAAAERAIKGITRASEIISRIQSLLEHDHQRRELLEVNALVDEMVPLLRGEAHEPDADRHRGDE